MIGKNFFFIPLQKNNIRPRPLANNWLMYIVSDKAPPSGTTFSFIYLPTLQHRGKSKPTTLQNNASLFLISTKHINLQILYPMTE